VANLPVGHATHFGWLADDYSLGHHFRYQLHSAAVGTRQTWGMTAGVVADIAVVGFVEYYRVMGSGYQAEAILHQPCLLVRLFALLAARKRRSLAVNSFAPHECGIFATFLGLLLAVVLACREN